MRILFAIRTACYEFKVIGGHGFEGVSSRRYRDEESVVGATERMLVYQPESESVQIRTSEGVGSHEPLGHMAVQETISLRPKKGRP